MEEACEDIVMRQHFSMKNSDLLLPRNMSMMYEVGRIFAQSAVFVLKL